MRSWSIPAGQWFGINFRIHLAFLFLFVFAWVIDSGGLDPRTTVPAAAVFTAIVLFSVVLHEIGHLLALRGSGAAPRAIVLLPIGGLWFSEVLPENPVPSGQPTNIFREFMVSAAGPVASVLVALIAAAALHFSHPEISLFAHPWVHIKFPARTIVWLNLFLAVLNLLPGFPLDGGRVLRTVLAQRRGTTYAARRAMTIANLVVLLLMFVGLWNTWLMLTGFFLFIGVQLEERTVVFQSVLQSVQMEEVMLTEFSTLSPADTLEDALSKAVHTLQDDFPVLRGADMVGVVSRKKILTALRSEGNGFVQSVMERGYETAGRKDSLASAFRKITRHGVTIIPVIDEEKLVGIVTLQNLMHSMGVLAESRKLRRRQQDEDFD